MYFSLFSNFSVFRYLPSASTNCYFFQKGKKYLILLIITCFLSLLKLKLDVTKVKFLLSIKDFYEKPNPVIRGWCIFYSNFLNVFATATPSNISWVSTVFQKRLSGFKAKNEAHASRHNALMLEHIPTIRRVLLWMKIIMII